VYAWGNKTLDKRLSWLPAGVNQLATIRVSGPAEITPLVQVFQLKP